jgi:flavin reductase (DIM6/NTAB) family NADH-FMN oxidoreductase RutF
MTDMIQTALFCVSQFISIKYGQGTSNVHKEILKMKYSFDPMFPPNIIGESWKDEFYVFHWLYHVINHPNFTFFITTYKDNGKNNVCLHAWGFVDSDPDQGTYFILSLNRNGHTYQNIKREGVLCINYHTQDNPRLGKTVQFNAYEDDEIGAPGLTAEECVKIHAPKIRECGLHLECSVLWEKEIPQSSKVVVACQVEYVTLEEALLNTDYREKLRAFDTHVCYTKQINPLTGEMNSVGGEGRLDPALFEDW